MKKTLTALALIFLTGLLTFGAPRAEAQSLNILVKDTFYGTLTGAGLGAASMALANDPDLRPLRIGTGLGTIGGVGVGIFDMATMTDEMQVYGLLSSSSTTGGIILLDTIYGSAVGSLVGMSVALISDSRVLRGLQDGAGIGAFGGFGFGLVDAFYFGSVGGDEAFFDFTSSNPDSFQLRNNTSGRIASGSQFAPSGLLSLLQNESYAFGALNPTIVSESMSGPNGNHVILKQYFGLEMLTFSARF